MSSITSIAGVNKSDKCLIIFSLVIILNFGPIDADIAVISSSNRTIDVFVDFELGFAASVPSEGIIGRLVIGQPEDGCGPMTGPPAKGANGTDMKWFVIVKRYPCQFTTKVQNAMTAGFDAVIIYNIDVTTVKKYSLVHSPQFENGITIPALLISFDDGWTLKREYLWSKGFYLMILPDLPFNLNAYLLPFAIVIGVCLLLMISFMIVKCIRDRKRRLRHRLSSRHLKQIPTQKFRKGDQYDTCAICLEEYTEGEKLRVLPCGHAYHLKCIDPWLTKNRRVCPVCKAKVIVPGMSDISDTESESENHNNSANERTPLLFADRTNNRNRNNRRRRRSYPQTNPTSEQTADQSANDSSAQNESQTGESVSASAPNVRLVEADITPVLAPTHLSINCDSQESVIEVADEASLAAVSGPHVEAKPGRSRRPDVIV